jgi:Flp pilus assembly protein TadD
MRMAALPILLVGASVGASAAEWIKITSPNFELYTTAGERTGKGAIKHFEQVRAFFLDHMAIKPSSPNKVRLVGFNSEKEWEPYKPNESAAAFYLPTPDRDYIVMKSLGEHFYQIAVHEYVHLLVKHSGVKAPVWFNEGLADFYSTVLQVGKKVRVGMFEPGRHQVLLSSSWMPLETLLRVNHDSPEYNERNRTGLFYAQSWALVHMLYFDQRYRDAGDKARAAILSGQSSSKVLTTTYNKALGEIQRDLRGYIRQDWQSVAHVDARIDAKVDAPMVEKAAPVDSQLTLAHVVSYTRGKEQAKAMYTKLAAEYPDNVEAQESLAYIHFREGEEETAARHFARASQLGSKNTQALRTHAYLLQRKDGSKEEAVAVLQRIVSLDPEFLDARLQLGYLLMGLRRYGQAYSILAEVKTLKADKAPALFRAMAYCLTNLNNPEAAKNTALRGKQYATDESDIAELDRILSWVEYAQNRAAPLAAPAESEATDVRRQVESQLSGEIVGRWKWLNEDAFATGKFVELVCMSDTAVLRLDIGNRVVSLLMQDPDKILIRGSDQGTIEMTCGPQPGKTVVVGFSPKVDEATKTDGVVGSLEFR